MNILVTGSAGQLGLEMRRVLALAPAEQALGIYHYTNERVCSWYDFAMAIRELIGATRCDLQPCRSSEYPSRVTRPAYSVLDKTKIRTAFNLNIPHWHASLKRCVAMLQGFTKDDLRFTNSDNGGSAAGK